MVRTLNQRCNTSDLIDATLKEQIRNFKNKIERLRIPLAKMEFAKRHRKDSPIAYPVISREFGVAWQLAQNIFVTRRELSDDLLKLLEKFNVN